MNYSNKKITKYLLFFLTLIGLSTLLYFRMENGPLRFSKEPGFYNDNFYLEIRGQIGHSIYYTLDGSTPTSESTLYTEPLYLDDASEHENVYSALTTTSTGFYTDIIHQFDEDYIGYTPPNYKVDKCHIVRAAMYDKEGHFVSEITGSYFINFENKDVYQNMRIVSLTSDPDNLFGDENGIYTTGNTFYEAIPDLDGSQRWYRWPANYALRGREFERDAYIEVYDTNHSLLLSEKCGIRIQGNVSRGFPQKTLAVFSRPEYSGSGTFDADLFGTGFKPHKFTLSSGGNDYTCKLDDYMIQSLVAESELNFSTMDYIPCMVFLDGEFWGMHYMAESYNDTYVNFHYNVPEENVVVIKNMEVTEGTENDTHWYHSVIGYVRDFDMSLAENYQQAQEYIDIQSFIDYYATHIYLARYGDWPGDNEAMWYANGVTEEATYQDIKWRWMMFDLNSPGMDMGYVDSNVLPDAVETSPLLASFMNNEEFRHQFVQRLIYIGEEVFTEERCNAFIDQYIEDLLPALCATNQRFYNDALSGSITWNADSMKQFFRERPNYVKQFIIEDFGEEYLPK